MSEYCLGDCKPPIRTSSFWTYLFIWLLAWALITRFSAFGDGAYTDDEAFYFLVGQRMHAGSMLYVDIWDRKGPGLFALYYLITALSRDFLMSQIAGLIAATLTAQIAALIAGRMFGRLSAVFAGTTYLTLLPFYGGGAAQSPVFYNLLIAVAALLIVKERDRLRGGQISGRVLVAMASAGSALTFKQTAVMEAGFLGCYCLWQFHAGKTAWVALLSKAAWLGLAGIAPMVIFAVGFVMRGHFAEFWQAMVGANLHRIYYEPAETAGRAGTFLLYCLPALALASGGLLAGRPRSTWFAPFLQGWLLASVAGVALVPNFFQHYALPLMLPASISAGGLMLRDTIWKLMGGALLAITLITGPAFQFAERAQSRAALADITQAILRRDPHPRLLVYEGPVDLYRRVNSYPPSPLLFPMHLFHAYEAHTSPFDTEAEMKMILAWHPTFVVTYADLRAGQENARTARLVKDYLKRCDLMFTRSVNEVFSPHSVAVYGPCSK